MKLAWIVPAPFGAMSGGYAYDRHIVTGLRALGHVVDVLELAGRHPLADGVALDAAAAALATISPDARPIVDGLGLPAFAHHATALRERGAVGLIHHPTALETGFADTDRDALRAVERTLFAALPRLVATSALTAEHLARDFGVDPTRVAVVEPGTDPAPRTTGSGGPPVALLSVGALLPRKGHDVLLRALATLPDLDWRLTVAGAPRDHAHAASLPLLAAQLGIAPRVTFAGELDDAALAALWASADVFALATWWEGYGMAVAEALARGVPVAMTAGGAVADLVPVEAGVMAQPGDAVGLGKALRRILFDHAMRAEMADAAWRAGQRLPRWADRAAAFAAAITPVGASVGSPVGSPVGTPVGG